MRNTCRDSKQQAFRMWQNTLQILEQILNRNNSAHVCNNLSRMQA